MNVIPAGSFPRQTGLLPGGGGGGAAEIVSVALPIFNSLVALI
jgi:hypothetical protein